MEAHYFQRMIRKTVGLRYWLYLPPGYEEQPGQKWPLVLFLHGRGERGSDLTLVKKHGLPRLIVEGKDFPFIVAAPQCPGDSSWLFEIEALNGLLKAITSELPVDRQRIYVTGFSNGSRGTWHLACTYPEWFAAAVPICGGYEPDRAYRMKDIPTWVFHGALDSAVPLVESERMVKALKAAGGKVRFTIYMLAGHDSWSAAYADPQLYEWLLQQKKP
jgi:predicted peptidase